MIDFSVAIRTYNRATHLKTLLERLRNQLNTEKIVWEIVIIDNNSTDNTAELIRDYQEFWPQAYPLRYFLETQQGASFARKRAIQEAKGQLIGFLDDDNFPHSNWVAAAYNFSKNHPQAVAYGSRILGLFEVEPPPNFKRIESFLALKDRGLQPNLYKPKVLSLPPGAGLVVKRQVWLDHVPKNLTLLGPVGESLVGKGEDFEALLYLAEVGEIWYNPDMVIDHEIPPERLKKDYLIKLIRSVGLTICQVRLTTAKNWEKPILVIRIILGNLRRIIVHLIKYRGKIKTDLVIACESEFFLSSLISPFYALKHQLKLNNK